MKNYLVKGEKQEVNELIKVRWSLILSFALKLFNNRTKNYPILTYSKCISMQHLNCMWGTFFLWKYIMLDIPH